MTSHVHHVSVTYRRHAILIICNKRTDHINNYSVKHQELLLWSKAVGRNTNMPNADQSHDTEQRKMSSALTYAQEGLFSKACHILTSSGIAPNSNTVFELLKSKHPLSDPPITPAMSTAPAIHVPPDFNVSAILRSFPKATACGPSGLRVQHLIDALDATQPTSIDSLLRQVINLLITGKVPAALAPYLASGNLTALMKLKELGWDVRPIAVGEVLRRLAGKCACALTNEKATDFFCSFSIWCSLPWRNREDHTQAQANS